MNLFEADDINQLDAGSVKKILDLKIGLYFAATATPFLQVENTFFLDLIETLRSIEPKVLTDYKPPTRQTLSSSILPKIHQKVNEQKKNLLKETNSIVLVDGWKNKSNNIKQLVFTLRNIKATQVFLRSHDVTKEREFAVDLAKNINAAIKIAEESYGTCVVGIETDNDAKIVAGARLARNSKNETLLQATCNSHSGNRLLKDLVPQHLAEQVKAIVKAFMSDSKLVSLIRQAHGTALEDWPDTRWCYFRDSCVSVHKNLKVLNDIWLVEDVNLPNEIGELLDSNEFKLRLEDAIKLMNPVCELINYCQNPLRNIADGTNKWLNLTLPTHEFDHVLAKRIEKAVSEVAYAAYFMHPIYKGLKLNETQKGIAMGFLEKKLDIDGINELTTFLRDRHDLTQQWPAIHEDPITYWTQLQFIMPKLAELCLNMMIMPASTSLIESLFSNWKYVHNPLRNQLSDHNSSLCVDIFHLSRHLRDGVWYNTKQKQKKSRLDLE